MQYSLSEIIARLGGQIEGEDVIVSAIASTDKAKAGELTFLTDKKYLKDLPDCQASAIIISSKDVQNLKLGISKIITDNPYLYYSRVVNLFHPKANLSIGIKDTVKIGNNTVAGKNAAIADYVVIGSNTIIGDNCQIHPGAIIGDNVIIGNYVTIHPQVVIYSNVKIGNNCSFHSGCVIGADGFGYASDASRHWHKIPQVGGVIIGNDVEVGANTAIDSGALGATIIEDGVKIDNLVQIAHNVKIGAHSAVAALAGIAGGTVIGKHCQIAGAAGITGHITIADYTVIGGASNVSKDITVADIYSSGIPAFQYKEWAKIMVYMRNWSDTQERIKKLEQALKTCLEKLNKP
ncbi:MAG: lpxD [Burkholderiales bacterium]|jgi:UDP-3-O-[3-hydroxymyristoyl] glucosamine N-acyltransferase|nr:lpxD [Burkholderiales bacterium]